MTLKNSAKKIITHNHGGQNNHEEFREHNRNGLITSHRHSHGHSHKDGLPNGEINIHHFSMVVLLNLGITLAEFVGGIVAGSLALISDSAHNLGDTLSLIISYAAARISKRPNNYQKTFGYKRANIVAAFLNSTALLVIGIVLIIEAIKRLLKPVSINTSIVFVVGLIGLIANFTSMLILRKWSKESLNIKSAYLHMLIDSLSSIAVLMSAVFIKIYNFKFLDSVMTILIAAYVIKEGIEIVRDSLSILMESMPVNIDIENINSALLKNPVIKDIHHLHIWALDEKNILFEAHVNLKEDVKVSDTMKVYTEIKAELEKVGINHVTIQFEYNGCKGQGLISCY
ncbi:cobalt-zinc-cadmium efflux system protein [Fervidobacterium changbaicum]|uniref:Cation transporter n=1 Tax=Fervidobacterium changbaicum TaxID=310769 RepID=A0ABX5QPZ4_9BACT|nr:cation diffusion facilitator family transporter [Fervidobacterium changbaicum]QAV32338.1 cation transporter [Fervidobacterium changbaicum]SDH21996.1 cobalt-zinc-cadmium efflux system protein [Fervidobacterium changbaicum]